MSKSDTSKPDAAPAFEGVRAKLAAHRDENSGSRPETLPQSGIKVEIPRFMHHGKWMQAQRQAKGDTGKAQAAMVLNTVTFEGERLTMADLQAGLIDAMDMLFLIGEVFKDAEEEGGNSDQGGNAQA